MLGRRRTITAVARAAAGAFVLCAALAGCGASTAQPPATLPTGAAPTAQAAAAGPTGAFPSASASIPADLTIDFQQPTVVPPGLQGLVNDAQEFVYAYEQAVAKGSSTDSLVQSLVTAGADVSLTTLLHKAVETGARPSGTVTFFRVTPSQSGSAEGVGFCEDDTKAVPVSDTTGHSDGAAPTGNSALREWNIGFSAGKGGKLVISLLATEVGSRACQ